MCIDNIEYKGPQNIPLYKMADRDKAFKLFEKCCKIIYGNDFWFKVLNGTLSANDEDTDWKKTAGFLRESVKKPVTIFFFWTRK